MLNEDLVDVTGPGRIYTIIDINGREREVAGYVKWPYGLRKISGTTHALTHLPSGKKVQYLNHLHPELIVVALTNRGPDMTMLTPSEETVNEVKRIINEYIYG